MMGALGRPHFVVFRPAQAREGVTPHTWQNQRAFGASAGSQSNHLQAGCTTRGEAAPVTLLWWALVFVRCELAQPPPRQHASFSTMSSSNAALLLRSQQQQFAAGSPPNSTSSPLARATSSGQYQISQLGRATSLASTPKAAGHLDASSSRQADMYIAELLSYSLDRMRKVGRLRVAVGAGGGWLRV